MNIDIKIFDKAISNIKSQMGKFLENQKILLDIKKYIDGYKKVNPQLYNEYIKKWEELYNKQKEIEQVATNFILTASQKKDAILLDPRTQQFLKQGIASVFQGGFFDYANVVINEITKISTDGLKVVNTMLKQNADVKNFRDLIVGKIPQLPERKISNNLIKNGMFIVYALLGTILTYYLTKRR